MTLLRKFLPTKFISRLLFLAVSLLLAVVVLMIWNSSTIRSLHQSQSSRPVGSSNLILPGPIVVEPNENADLPHMYQDFEKNPKDFAKRWKGKMPTIAPKHNIRADTMQKKKKERKGTPRITCIINNGTKTTCLRAKTGEVYMPFKFIKKYFEVYGDFNNDTTAVKNSGKKKSKNKGTFYFRHSITPLWSPTAKYTAEGEFLYFKEYDVGGRSRVMLISGVHGVPVSNQWDKAGYIYPIQVAQYGLSHYSKLVQDGGLEADRRTVLEDGTEGNSKWTPTKHSKILYTKDNVTGNSVIYFNTTVQEAKFPALSVNEKRIESCLSFDVKFVSRLANVSVVIEAEQGLYVLTYHSEEFFKKPGEDNMQYGIGACKDWCTLHRDLLVDFKKFAPRDNTWKQIRSSLISIQQIEVRGEGYLDNVQISRSCHRDHFKDASDWILKNQDSRGGWPVTVKRSISKIVFLEPGWYSAMGQGQAISLLVRAYVTYKKPEYLAAATKGLGIYQNLSTEHGVRARFLDKYNWYEEYPTTPALFVLNGFIYSLFGLYDLASVAQGEAKVTAQRLYDDGMVSLKVMLPFYDSGTGTFYDLRHFTMPGTTPNRARWDYHAVHIAQLLNLGTIDSNPIFNTTAERWVRYMKGDWAPHN